MNKDQSVVAWLIATCLLFLCWKSAQTVSILKENQARDAHYFFSLEYEVKQLREK